VFLPGFPVLASTSTEPTERSLTTGLYNEGGGYTREGFGISPTFGSISGEPMSGLVLTAFYVRYLNNNFVDEKIAFAGDQRSKLSGYDALYFDGGGYGLGTWQFDGASTYLDLSFGLSMLPIGGTKTFRFAKD
jgi:hypothetical protein